MEERPPSSPRVAWEESGAPRERKPPPEPYEVTEVQPLRADADWLPVYAVEKEAVDYIEAYVNMEEKDLVQKMQFLNCICLLCSNARRKRLTASLDIFSFLNNLPEHIEVLLCEEPREQLTTALRYHCMNAIAALSEATAISESEILHLLNVCFSVIFNLPPKENLNICLYNHTLSAMDNMLWIVLHSHPTSSIDKQLQSIFEVLLPFTISKRKTVCERAMERIQKLCGCTASSFRQQLRRHEHSSQALSFFASQSCLYSSGLPARKACAQPLGKNLHPSQRTDIVLATLEKITGDYSSDEKEWAEAILDVVRRDPGTWLMDVPEILGYIQTNLKIESTSVQQILFSVLDLLAIQFPKDVLRSMLTDLPQTDSTTLDMWSSVLPVLKTSEHILDELSNVLQDQRLCENCNVTTAELSLLRLTVMHPTEENMQQLCQPACLQRLLKIESLPLLWLVLTGLVLLSERPETAGVIRALLPEVMETLRFASTPITLKVLNIFRNVMRNLGKRQASPIALQLAEKILPLFNHVSSEVREGSIRLFKEVMDAVVWCKKGNMKKAVRRGLLPLLFQMSDETPSVAQASGEALVACAKFLKWKELKHQAREENTVGIRMCLLQQDRRRVEGYLWQSLPYLKDSQASLRCEAVTFLGLAVQHSREQSEEMLNEICNALQPLEDDAHPAVRSLAAGTIQMLRHERQQAASARSRLAALCCWPCIAI
ncbi:uncharacterized protein LOC112530684 [Gallus gallus]|uniref:uncharacterized protein LOC112530684 n=1 Tax=Gallus gallus TaxID=9031 RepID=UPI001AE8F2A2|nr:uncharacterized protein LOC112530684 [Gallus gallus]XP_046792095.1 uncharacterized protein LOC112530684 [Gallus gallus]